MKTTEEPFLAFSCLLVTLIASSFLQQITSNFLQAIEFQIDLPFLVRYALPIVFLPCLWLTYGYLFLPSRRNITVGIILAAILAALGIASAHILDFTTDAMAYHIPVVSSILNGWNPLYIDYPIIPLNFFPFGVPAVGASLAALYGSIEAAKILHVWWIFIALPVVIAGLRNQFGALQPYHYCLALLLVLNPLVIGQSMTHYLDGIVYLEGITFIGALMMRGQCPHNNRLSNILMAISLFLLIHTKLTGLYWGIMLCLGAVIYCACQEQLAPKKITIYLFTVGAISTLIFGYHPYITNIVNHPTMLPWSSEEIISWRPPNLRPLPSGLRLLYSIFSVMGANVGANAILKFPWIIEKQELLASLVDSRTSGFGALFALGTLSSIALFCWNVFKQKTSLHKGLCCLAIILLVFNICFPESWWARYAPFTYAIPLILLLASARPHFLTYFVCLIFVANSFIAIRSTYFEQTRMQRSFNATIKKFHQAAHHHVVLVPTDRINFIHFNQAHLVIIRRLQERGIDATLKINDPCPNKLAKWVQFEVCYE